MKPPRRLGWAHPLLGVALVALYLPTLARGITFSDGPEITTAITTLGVMHPTGYPLFTLLAHAFTRLVALPIAQVLKIEVFNALAAAGAAVLAARSARAIALSVQEGEASPRDADLAGLAAGALLGVSPLLWANLRIPEVYAFHLLLVSGAVHFWIRFERTHADRDAIAASALMGLGLAHHVTMIYLVPAALLLLALRKPTFFTSRSFPLALVVGALPLVSYGYLLWANATTTGVAWGDVHDLPSLVAHVTGKQYQRYLSDRSFASIWSRLRTLGAVYDAQFLAVSAVLFFPGVTAALRRARRAAIFLIVFALFNVAHAVVYAVGDHATYYLPALLPCSIFLGVGLAVLLGWARRRTAATEGRPGLLAGVITAGAGLLILPAAGARAWAFAHDEALAEEVGAELATAIPPGSLLLTSGDGVLFTMWYEAHVLGRGDQIGTLDVTHLDTPWYRRDLARHFPRACDPLASALAADPAAFAARCGTMAQRVASNSAEAWFSLALEGAPPPSEIPPPEGARVLRGADPRCAEATFRAAHPEGACGCWAYAHGKGPLGDTCVVAADEGGIVSRAPVEITVQRLVEDHLDTRPVFERGAVTRWEMNPALNPRGWDGPSGQRISADYALVNRGRFNQIVRAEAVRGLDACAGERLTPVRSAPMAPAERAKPGAERRRPYRPNEAPTLIGASWLVPSASRGHDAATRALVPGDAVVLKIEWFERYHYAPNKPLHRGAPLRHGLRVCVFDREGRRVAEASTIAGARAPVALMTQAPAGAYTVQACSVGEVGEGDDPAGRACERVLLEYPFAVLAR